MKNDEVRAVSLQPPPPSVPRVGDEPGNDYMLPRLAPTGSSGTMRTFSANRKFRRHPSLARGQLAARLTPACAAIALMLVRS